MKYLKLFENDITYPVEKLVEIVNLAEENSKNITEYVKKYASLIVSLTLYEVSQDISKYKEIIKKFEKNLEIMFAGNKPKLSLPGNYRKRAREKFKCSRYVSNISFGKTSRNI